MNKLSYKTLEQMGYDGYLLKDAPEKVLQFGEGNFLRAFVDYFFDMANDCLLYTSFRYLAAAFGSALITSVYSVVDMAVVGQAVGPQGTAALAVVAPVWNAVYSLGLLMGIGGSVLLSNARGRNSGNANEYFTAALAGACVLAGAAWLLLWLWEEPILVFFGADAQLLELAQRYLEPVKIVVPVFVLNQMLAAFLRNDGNPVLATACLLYTSRCV